MSSQFRIDGMGDILKKLEELANAEQSKALKAGLTKGAAEVRKAARANAKALDDTTTDEKIFQNIKSIQWKVKKGRKYLGRSVGVDSKNGSGGDTYYWRFLEFGTKRTTAKPFLLPALESQKDKALEAMKDGAQAMIDKISKQ